MSTTIDQRVVEMRFDNQHFERNVQTSMSTLDKLKQKLNFSGASKGLEDINAAAKNCNLSPIGTAVEGVRVKFSALEVMAVTALSNITNSAVNAGKRIVSALTIDPIKTGFEEYETQINAVQTILANTKSKGSTLEDVNNALDELNTYADKTIYNFTEMTRNIGTFTAAGIDLDTSVSAIQGIANLAAVSGSTSQQASTAMYQLSQALAAGTVKLMDWNSVVNAGMGGEIFQEALKKTSEELKTGAAAAIEAEGSFRESLSTGWLTSEVLTETLKKFTTSGANEYVAEYTGLSKEAVEAALEDAKAKYGEADAIEYASKALAEKSGKNADEIQSVLDMAATSEDAATKVKTFTQLWDTLKESAQSGWTQTWEIIIGDFEEAKELLTGLSDFFGNVIQKISDARNKVLEGALGRTFSSLSEKINSALAPAQKAADAVNKVTESISDLGGIVNDVILGKFGNGQDRIDKLTESGQNYYRIQNKVNETLGNAFRYTDEQIEAQDKLLGVQKETTDGTKEETAETVKLTDEKKNLIKEIASMTEEQMRSKGYTDEQIDAFKELGKTADKLGMPLDEFIDKMDEIDGRWLLIDSFKSIGKGLVEVFKAIGEAWKNVFPSTIDDKADTLFNIIAAFHKFSRGILTAATENADKFRRTFEGLFAILDIVRTIAGGALGFAFKLLKAILSSMNLNILDVTASIGDAIVAFRNWLKENNFIVTALEKLGSFIGKAIIAIRDFVKMVLEIPAVQSAITNFKKACSDVFSKIGNFFSEGGKRIADFIDRVRALDSLTLEDLKNIFIDFKDNVLGYFFNFDKIFDGAKNVLSQFRDKVSEVLGSIGGKFEWVKDKISGLVEFIKEHIPQIIAVVMGFGLVKALKKVGDALEIIAGPIEGLSDILENVSKAVESFSGYIKAKAWNEKADAVLKLAIALGILAASIWVISKIDPDRLWASVGALAALMGVLVVFTLLITLINRLGSVNPASLGKGLSSLGIYMLALAASLMMLVESLKKMEELNPDKIWGSLGVLAVVAVGLTALTAVLTRVGGKGSLRAAISMIALVVALKMMVGVLTDLDKIKLTNAGKSITILAGLIIGFAVVLKASKGVKMGGAVALIAIAIALKLVISAMKSIARMNTNEINKGLRGIIPIFGIFALVMAASKLAGQNAAKAGVGILAMSVAIVVLTHAIKQLGGMNKEMLDRGLTAVSMLMAVFGAIVVLSAFAGKNAVKAGVMLLMMSGAMLILTGVIWALQGISDEGMDRALGAIVTMGIVFAALIAVSKLATGSKGMIIALTVAVVALAAVLIALSLLDPDSLTRATIALDSIMGVFALLVLALSTIKKANVGSAIGAVLVLTVVVIALAAVIAALTFLPNTSALLPAAEALSLLLLALAASLFIISKCKKIAASTMGAAAALAGITILLGVILGALTLLPNPQNLLPVAVALSILLLAFSAALLIISQCKKIAASTMGAAAALAGITILLGVVLGALSLLPNPQNLLPVAVALSLLLNAFASALLIISQCKKIAASTMGAAAALAGITILLGVVLGALSLLPNPQNLLPVAVALSLLLNAFASALLIISQCKKIAASTMGAAVALAGITIILGVVLGALSLLPSPQNLLPAAVALSLLLEALASALLIISQCKKIAASTMGAAAALAGIMVILGAILGAMSFLPNPQNLLPAAVALSLLLEALAVALLILSKCGNISASTMGAAYAMSGVIAIIGGILSAMSFLPNIDALLPIAESLSLMLLALSVSLGILCKLNVNVGAATQAALGLDAFVGIFAALLAALGGLAQIPGFTWLIGEGIELLSKIGYGLGEFVGSIIGGIGAGITSGLPDMADNLSLFATKIQPFVETMSNTDGSILNIVKLLAETILILAGAAFLDAISGLFGLDFSSLGTSLVSFAHSMKDYATVVSELTDDDIAAIETSAEAAHSLAALAKAIPKQGGVSGWLFGETNFTAFGTSIVSFAHSLVDYAEAVKPLTEDDITKIQDSTIAAGYLTDLAEKLPTTGGVAGWLFGETNFIAFGSSIVSFAYSLIDYAAAISDFNSDDLDKIKKSATAAEYLTDVAEKIPSTGGALAWLFGETNMTSFGTSVVSFGKSLMDYAKIVSEFTDDDTENIKRTESGIEAMVDAVEAVPTTGGVAEWFTGSKDLGKFGSGMVSLAQGLNAYAEAASQIDDTKIEQIKDSKDAVSELVKVAEEVPSDGNILSMITGDRDIGKFGSGMVSLAEGLIAYSDAASQIDDTKIEKIENSKDAVEALTEVANAIPTTGGAFEWFTGSKDLSEFGSGIVSFADSMVTYANKVSDITEDDVTAVKNSAAAATAMGEAAAAIPNSGGVAGFFAGENDIADFGSQLISFANQISLFIAKAETIPENAADIIKPVTDATGAMVTLADTIPNSGGVAGFFAGENDISTFGAQLSTFANGVSGFISKCEGVTDERVASIDNVKSAITKLAGVWDDENLSSLTSFSSKSFSLSLAGVESFATLMNKLSETDFTGATSFATAMTSLGSVSADDIVEGFKSSASDMTAAGETFIDNFIEGAKSNTNAKTVSTAVVAQFIEGATEQKTNLNDAGKTLVAQLADGFVAQISKFKDAAIKIMKQFIEGIESKKTDVKKAAKNIAEACVTELKDKSASAKVAGMNFAIGFANGISENAFRAKAQAAAMAKAALEAAEDVLDINSPSKETYRIGSFFGQGFVNAVEEYSSKSYDTAYGMADYAKRGLSGAISRINDVMNSDIDTQPTIRPVIDLTDVKSGASTISSMLNRKPSIGVMSDIGSISSMMSWQSQNGSNDDVVSAIKNLSDKLSGSSGDSYSINGITYDDGTNVSNAVQTLVRAARIGRRR